MAYSRLQGDYFFGFCHSIDDIWHTTNNPGFDLRSQSKIVQAGLAQDQLNASSIDALQFYDKYTDVFYMEDVAEAERIETARQVADQILPRLRDIDGYRAIRNSKLNPTH